MTTGTRTNRFRVVIRQSRIGTWLSYVPNRRPSWGGRAYETSSWAWCSKSHSKALAYAAARNAGYDANEAAMIAGRDPFKPKQDVIK